MPKILNDKLESSQRSDGERERFLFGCEDSSNIEHFLIPEITIVRHKCTEFIVQHSSSGLRDGDANDSTFLINSQ